MTAFSAKSYNFIFIKEIVFSAGAAIMLASFFAAKEPVIKGITFMPLLFIAWMAVSMLLGKYGFAGVPALMTGCALFLFFIAVSNAKWEISGLRDTLALSSIPFLVIGLMQAFFPLFMKEFMVFGSRVPSTFGNPNFFGAYLAGIAPCLLAGGLSEKGVKKYLYFALLAAAAFCLIVTGSKAAVIGFILVVSMPYFIFIRKSNDIKKNLVVLACLTAVIIIATVAIMGQRLSKTTDRKEWVKNESVFFRAYTWKGTLGIIRDNLIAGTGPGTFEIVYPRYRPPEIMLWSHEHSYETLQPENVALQAAAETGVAGLLILFFLLYMTIKHARREHNEFLAGLLAVLLVNLTGVDINYVPSSMLAVFFAGIIFSSAGGRAFAMKSAVKNTAIVVSAVLLVLIVTQQVKHHISGIYLKRAVFYSQSGQWNEAINNYGKALEMNGNNLTARYFLASSYRDSGFPQKALLEYFALEKLAPDYVLLHYKKARIYDDAGNYGAAADEYGKMLETDPYLKPAIVGMSRISLEVKKDPAQAEKYLKRALEKHPGDASLYNNMGNIYFMSKRLPESAEAFKKAVDLKPDKDYYYNLGCVYFTMNDIKNAKFYLEKAREMGPKEEKIINMIRKVEKYGK